MEIEGVTKAHRNEKGGSERIRLVYYRMPSGQSFYLTSTIFIVRAKVSPVELPASSTCPAVRR